MQKYKRTIDEADTSVPPAADGGGRVAHSTDSKDEHESEVSSHVHDGEISASTAESRLDSESKGERVKRKTKTVVEVDADDDPMDGGSVCSISNNSAEAQTTPSESTKGKGKAKSREAIEASNTPISKFDASVGMGPMPPRPPPPRRPGWGRRPEEEFFHTDPRPKNGRHKKGSAFCKWPGDAKGRLRMVSQDAWGKLSPDGYPWGETLYDFFCVNRLPEVDNNATTVTGSKLLEATLEMERWGRLDVAVEAAEQIRWAWSEGEPRIEGVADTEELIWNEDKYGLKHGVVEGTTDESGVGDNDDNTLPADIPPPPTTIPITSPLHPSNYPKPRAKFPPIEHPTSILLQERIPLHLLPKTLYVHDRFCVLSAIECQSSNTKWTFRPDVIRTYNLQLSESVRSQVEDTRRKAQELEEFKARTKIFVRYRRTKEQIENFEPEIEVLLPTYVRRPTKIEESHLYISPVSMIGKGNHSLVYKAEWEIQRDLFVKGRICPICFKKSVDEEIQTLKETGEWDNLLKAGSNELNDPVNSDAEGEIFERELICVAASGLPPAQIVESLDDLNVWDKFRKRWSEEGTRTFLHKIEAGLDGNDPTGCSSGMGIRVTPHFSKSCPHGKARRPVPRTVKFTVVAKLSIENDAHLPREAMNYQGFPEHFFHHYNGYTIIPRLRPTVPVHAIVPQFYGYYTPEAGPLYLSPILLLEHCGQPIDPKELTLEQQEECASLLLRFQRAGWLHESVASRNFLVQYGKPTEFPLTRLLKPELSFRLIDFGRSRNYVTIEEKRMEEKDASRMFKKLGGNWR